MRLGGNRPYVRNKLVEDNNDLGFGTKICSKGGRLINRNGTFNVERKGWYIWTPYQWLVEMSWLQFFLVTGVAYLAVNALFALFFLLCGVDSFSGIQEGNIWSYFFQLFFHFGFLIVC